MVMAIYSTKDKVVYCCCNLTSKRKKTFKHNIQQAFTISCRSQSVDMQTGHPEMVWVTHWVVGLTHKSRGMGRKDQPQIYKNKKYGPTKPELLTHWVRWVSPRATTCP